ncbi:MAG: hypothetical protein ACP5IE_05900 [Infirmifilum sp.]
MISDYDYGILKEVDCYLANRLSDVAFSSKAVVATAWQTAYFVKEYAKRTGSRPYYLVFHEEDDPSYSGPNSPLAKETYSFPFKKIVINRRVYYRFNEERPLFFHVGFDISFYRAYSPLEGRKTTIFQLVKGEHKGSKYALEAIAMLLEDRPQLSIVTFGNLPYDDIPAGLRGKFDHRGC